MENEVRTEIYNKAIELSTEVYDEQILLFDFEQKQRSMTEENASLEAEIFITLCGELNEAEKPKYSNEAMRNSETKTRLKDHKEFQGRKEEIRKIEKDIYLKKNKIQYLNSKISLSKAFLHGS